MYDDQCTLVSVSVVDYLLPRLDMYYFQRPGSLESWGRAWFGARVRARHLARRVRSMAAGTAPRLGMRTR